MIGDVRDSSSLYNAMHNVDFVFHAVALKQVSCDAQDKTTKDDSLCRFMSSELYE